MNTSSSNTSSSAAILQLAECGMTPKLVESLLNFSNENDISGKQKCYLLGPIVQHDSSWKDATPEWMIQAVFPERAEIIRKELNEKAEGWRIGPAELATALYPAVMEASLSYETSQVFLWASAKAIVKYRKEHVNEIKEQLQLSNELADSVLQEDGAFFSEYKELCTNVREAVIRQFKKQWAKDRMKDVEKMCSLDNERER